jgi:hypothetical protein
MARKRALFTLAVWAAFVARGCLHTLMAPLWDGFDEAFHLAYVLFVAEEGRPPGLHEPSFPADMVRAIPALPTFLGGRGGAPRWRDAPSFEAWRAMSPDERLRRRALASRFAYRPYDGENYERQQGPLFYVLSAPFARLLRGASMPAVVVGMRLWCVLVASLAVPLTARFLRLALPARGVFLGLPLLLAPNTSFFVFRVTNDALAFALAPAVCLALLLVARRPSARRALARGLLAGAGAWTKLTLGPAVVAAIVAVLLARRRRSGRSFSIFAFGALLPLGLLALLLLWNELSTGSWTALVEATRISAGPLDYAAGFLGFDASFWIGLWARTHLWAGGWGFLQPSHGVYAAVWALLLVVVALLVAKGRANAIRPLRRSAPVLAFAALFVFAMVFHVVSMMVSAERLGTGPKAGGEGWYFDLLRPVEALVLASLLCAVVRSSVAAVAALELGTLLILDALGTLFCLVPEWAGLAPSRRPHLADVLAALDAGPLRFPPALALALALGVAAAAALAVRAAGSRPRYPRPGGGGLPRPEPRRERAPSSG